MCVRVSVCLCVCVCTHITVTVLVWCEWLWNSVSIFCSPFPEDMPEEENALAEESIYANLEDIEW